ncbi:MAG: SDR family NAD(P)-dependent oxidoreductase [Gammaproteobacteria bacterium]
MTQLSENVILVTGGSTGIGRSTAKILSAEGARVIIFDVQDDQGQQTVAEINDEGGAASYMHVDVANYEQVRAAVKKIANDYGRLDGAFNNAGIEGPALKILDYGVEDWDRVIRVNLTGVFACMKCEIEQMVNQPTGGSIVSTASVAGLVGLPGACSYNSAKHGVVGLTKTVALEYASSNIRVNAVCPGFIETPMLDRVTDASVKIRDKLIGQVPMKRVASAEEIGHAVAWLMSDKSSYVTGVALPVDGGWFAQ